MLDTLQSIEEETISILQLTNGIDKDIIKNVISLVYTMGSRDYIQEQIDKIDSDRADIELKDLDDRVEAEMELEYESNEI